ncbi:hypothetical protein IFM89_010838 [Coptis chinensis]|uniref:Uncharacterized protein n=1 Tax=Coptis chinensis TaxID=261450 RepID=A0A835I1D2_9MAGN|nr:hypothetical protein IFM89_010838 [Coptis chinensis]
MFRLKNFCIEQLSEYDKGHPVKEGELVVTFAQLEYGLMIPLDKEVSRVLSVWHIPPIQVSMSLWLVFVRAHALVEAYPEMKFKGLPKGYQNWDKYCFLVIGQVSPKIYRFWNPYATRVTKAPRQQVTMLEARQVGDEQRDNKQRPLVTASPILETRLKTQKRKITDEAANDGVEELKALEVLPKSMTLMERRSKRKANKDFNGTHRPKTIVANKSVEVGVKEVTWAEGTPDDGRWLSLVPLTNEGTGSNMIVIEKDSEIIRGQPQSMEIEQKSATPNGAMEERTMRDTTSVSIPVGDITLVEPLELVSIVFLDDEVIEALRPHADIDFSTEMVEEYMHNQLLLPELRSSNTKEVEETSELCILGMQTLQKAMENFAKLMGVLEKEKHAMPGPLMADLVQKEKEEAKDESARA